MWRIKYYLRDLKPENFLFHDKKDLNTLNLIEFGVAAICNEGVSLKTCVGSVSRKMNIKKKYYYQSPECLEGNYDARTEIWTLGVILYTFLCGYTPFFGLLEK